MIDPADKQTQPLALDQPEKRKPGRPATGRAMTPAEKQRAYRERQKLKGNVTLTKSELCVLIGREQEALIEKSANLSRRGEEMPESTRKWHLDLIEKLAKAYHEL